MAGVKFTVHADSPTGPVVATVENVPYTGSTSILNRQYKWFSSGAVTDPGGVHDLYFVTEWAENLQPEVFVRSLQFVTAPENVTATVAPAAPNGANGWYTSPVTVTVDTGGAPLWTRQVSLDGGTTWINTDADGEATVDADGTTTVRYRAIDSGGTVADGGSLTVSIDRTAPTTGAELRPASPGAGGIYRGAVNLSLSAADGAAGSGVPAGATEYRVDGGTWTPYSHPFTVSALGAHLVEYRSSDAAGNVEAIKTLTFAIARPDAPPARDAFVGLMPRSSEISVAAFRRAGLRLRALCLGVESGRLRLSVSRRVARRLGLDGTTLASRSVRCGTDSRLSTRLKPSRRVTNALRRATGSFRATLHLRMSGESGTASDTVRLVLRGKRPRD